MKYSLFFCLVLIGGTACHKSGGSGSANYDSITPIGTNPFASSLLSPHDAVAAGNQIVFGAGLLSDIYPSDSVFIFDAAKDQWSEAATSACHYMGAYTTVNNLIIFAGGDNYPKTYYAPEVDIYDPSTGKWTTAMLSQGRSNLAAASAGSIAAFGGGTTASQAAVATVDLYNATTGKWTVSALSSPRLLQAAAGAGTKIVFAGGETPVQYSDVVDIYDTQTGLWTATHLSAPREAITAAAVGNQLLFAGGYNADGYSDAVDIYDVSTGKWSTSRLRTPCSYNGGVISSGNLACFFSSHNNKSNATDTVDIYNASTRSWSAAAVLPQDRSTLCSGAIGNQVITIGAGANLYPIASYYQLK